MAKVSIVIPVYDMPNRVEFMKQCMNSIAMQDYNDYEVLITRDGKMAENTNSAIRRATGEIIKILFMDDAFIGPRALGDMVEAFSGYWMVAGTDNNPEPKWTDDIYKGNNRLGSPSALMFKNEDPLMFDERMSWMLDCDYYYRMCQRYGEPQILSGRFVKIGQHEGQMTNVLTDEQKLAEVQLTLEKYGN